MSKHGKVREHLLKNGHISSWEAIQLYGATRLSAIIYNLRHEGYNITNEWCESIDRYGDKSRYVDYRLDEKQMIEANSNHIPYID